MAKSINKAIKITQTDKDKDVYEFEIIYKGTLILINCKLEVKQDTLFLRQIDIDGPGANTFGVKMKGVIKEIALEFCKKYRTTQIEISGARRAAGRTKGTYLKPITYTFTKA